MAKPKKPEIPAAGLDVQVPSGWRPRPYQLPLWRCMTRGDKKRACAVWHRRAGKDHLAINLIATEMLKRPGQYWHILPTYAQGRKDLA